MAQVTTNVKVSEDYSRLQQLEQKILSCIRIAAEVAECLALVRHGHEAQQQRADAIQRCTEFMASIRDAHLLIQQGVSGRASEMHLELHAYHNLARAHINTEKLEVLRMHLQTMQASMRAAGAWQQQQQEGAAGAPVGAAAPASAPPATSPVAAAAPVEVAGSAAMEPATPAVLPPDDGGQAGGDASGAAPEQTAGMDMDMGAQAAIAPELPVEAQDVPMQDAP